MKGSYFLGGENTPKFQMREMTFAPLGPGQVLVKVHGCGVCGTDVHIYHGEEGSAQVTPPVVLGHEFSGIVEAVGPGVTVCRPGDPVAVDPNVYCGKCRPCRMGKKQNCRSLYAFGVNADGGFADHCVVPQEQCYPVGPEVDLDAAAMMEPLACAIHGMDNLGMVPGENVLVIGGGAIGQIMVQLAKLSGAARVLLSEPVKARRELGLELGADEAVDPLTEDLPGKIREVFGTEGADVVIECAGTARSVAQAIASAGAGGKILIFSVPGAGAAVSLPLTDVFKKELKITGSIINPDTNQRAVDLIRSGRIQVKKLITHVFDTEHLEEAILCQMGSDSIKVLVKPRG